MKKPIEELLKEADAMINSDRTRSYAPSGEHPVDESIEKFAQALIDSSSVLAAEHAAGTENADLVAESLNRLSAAQELEADFLIDEIEKVATEKNLNSKQVEEVLSKFAAQKIKNNLALLVAIGGLPPYRGKPALVGKYLSVRFKHVKNLTESMGY